MAEKDPWESAPTQTVASGDKDPWEKDPWETSAPAYQEPQTLSQKLLQGLSKGIDVFGSATKVPLAAAYDAATGKQVMTPDEMKRGFDLSTFQRSPDFSEMMKRANIPNPSWNWDKINPPVVNPNTGQNRSRITDILPSNVGQIADLATNPLNWAGWEAKALTPTEVALQAAKAGENPTAAVLAMAPKASEPSMASNIWNGVKSAVANPVSTSMEKVGTGLYNSAIDPVLTQGTKAGKEASEIGDTLFRSGIKTPWGLSGKAAQANSTIMGVVNDITKMPKGAANMEETLAPAQNIVDKYSAVKDPGAEKVAQSGQALLDYFRNKANGTPGTPEIPAQAAIPEKWSVAAPTKAMPKAVSGGLDQWGNPIPGKFDLMSNGVFNRVGQVPERTIQLKDGTPITLKTEPLSAETKLSDLLGDQGPSLPKTVGVAAYDAEGNLVGRLPISPELQNPSATNLYEKYPFVSSATEVHPDFRDKGLASKMYDYANEHITPLVPSKAQSYEGANFSKRYHQSAEAPLVGYTPAQAAVPGRPATPGIPAQPYSAADLQAAKQARYATNVYNPAVSTPAEGQISKALSAGEKAQIEKMVSNEVSPQASQSMQDLNADAGNMLSTKRGQLTTEANTNRTLNSVANPVSGTKGILAALDPHQAGWRVGLKTLADLLRTGAMPTGYGMRTVGESPLSPLLDMTARQSIMNNANKGAGQ